VERKRKKTSKKGKWVEAESSKSNGAIAGMIDNTQRKRTNRRAPSAKFESKVGTEQKKATPPPKKTRREENKERDGKETKQKETWDFQVRIGHSKNRRPGFMSKQRGYLGMAM
jgi:hypothetical protein